MQAFSLWVGLLKASVFTTGGVQEITEFATLKKSPAGCHYRRRPMSPSHPKGDVSWCLPGKKKPFTYSPIATSRFIQLLAEDGHTARSAIDASQHDDEAKAILQAFVDAGYGEALLSKFISPWPKI